GIHCAPALSRPAVARCLLVAALVEAVVVGNFLPWGDVPDGLDPDAAAHLAGLAVWIATVVDKHGKAVPVDHDRAVTESKQVGHRGPLIADVGVLLFHACPGVLGNAGAFANSGGCVAACGMNAG